jgi:predicted RNA methylase
MQKGGKLFGGSATAEVVASAKKVLAPNRSGRTIGLQQFYTPYTAASWIASVTGTAHNALDLTAGDGALLLPYVGTDERTHFRWGVEIDVDQIHAAAELKRPYRAIHGDVQHVYPLIRGLGLHFQLIVANPPFGLDWEEPTLGKGSSTLLCRLGSTTCSASALEPWPSATTCR